MFVEKADQDKVHLQHKNREGVDQPRDYIHELVQFSSTNVLLI